jgi:transposase
VARRHLAGHQQGAQVQPHTILFRDESGVSPRPSVVRTSAPVGQTPLWREWDTRDHLSAISAIAPEGKRSCHAQEHSLNSADVVAWLAHLLREVPGRMLIIWDGAPMQRRQVIKTCLADGAAQRMPLERLPAYAPECNPGEGLWEQLTGVERRHVCCFNSPHLRGKRRAAVKRVRQKPRVLQGFFQGAKR